MLCSWNLRLLYSKSIDWKIIGLEPCQNVSVRGSVESNNNNNKQKGIPKKIYLFPHLSFSYFFYFHTEWLNPTIIICYSNRKRMGRRGGARSFLYSILHPYYFLFHFISLSPYLLVFGLGMRLLLTQTPCWGLKKKEMWLKLHRKVRWSISWKRACPRNNKNGARKRVGGQKLHRFSN